MWEEGKEVLPPGKFSTNAHDENYSAVVIGSHSTASCRGSAQQAKTAGGYKYVYRSSAEKETTYKRDNKQDKGRKKNRGGGVGWGGDGGARSLNAALEN